MAIEAAQGEERAPLAAQLALNADGILEQIAREYGVSTLGGGTQSAARAPHGRRRQLFAEIMQDVTTWGDILFIVHTPDIELKCSGPLPPGTYGRGYYNVHGESPIGGHIRAENCTAIAFVSRPFMGRPSRSIQFFNASGEAMFKIFVRRDEARELIAGQVAKFDALRERCQGTARGHN